MCVSRGGQSRSGPERSPTDRASSRSEPYVSLSLLVMMTAMAVGIPKNVGTFPATGVAPIRYTVVLAAGEICPAPGPFAAPETVKLY